VHELHDVGSMFQSPDALKAQIKMSFEDKMRPTMDQWIYRLGTLRARDVLEVDL